MSGGARKDEDHGSPPTDEAALSARLRRLGERLEEAGANEAAQAKTADRAGTDFSGFARGLRLSGEFVAGVLVGVGLGFLVDRGLRVSPWGLIVFTLLGAAAGVLNLVRAGNRAPDGPPPRRQD
jgi:ATP synthase protein I